MEFAVNYSEALLRLLRQGMVRVDRLKLPAWPSLIDLVQGDFPFYVHFPLVVGSGMGDARDDEHNALADWRRLEALMTASDTPMINVHLAPDRAWYAGVEGKNQHEMLEVLLENTLRDLEGVVRRWGRERIVAENSMPAPSLLPVCAQPAFIRAVVETAGIGFLLDVSHARLAARFLRQAEMNYLQELPLEHCREMHITGIQRLEGSLLEKLRQNPPKEFDLADWAGREIDHQALTANDFAFLQEVLALIPTGRLREPWVAAMEYGGVGPFWELSLSEQNLAEQLPRLWQMTRSIPAFEEN